MKLNKEVEVRKDLHMYIRSLPGVSITKASYRQGWTLRIRETSGYGANHRVPIKSYFQTKEKAIRTVLNHLPTLYSDFSSALTMYEHHPFVVNKTTGLITTRMTPNMLQCYDILKEQHALELAAPTESYNDFLDDMDWKQKEDLVNGVLGPAADSLNTAYFDAHYWRLPQSPNYMGLRQWQILQAMVDAPAIALYDKCVPVYKIEQEGPPSLVNPDYINNRDKLWHQLV